ncbi:MAG: site-2 protease family protein [Pseudomonadota bacterium]|nr:site-2 protease family protein [Pseudomonadota bacterium]
MTGTLFDLATLILPLVFAIVCHEVAHGAMARLLGDRTAEEQGRLTLNPLPHVDPLGTVILPGLLALTHLPVFGWAKPVPVNQWRLRNPRWGMMLVAAAGPGSNLLLAGLAAVGLGLLARAGVMAGVSDSGAATALAAFTIANLVNFLSINLFLALFNLLPIPPFDGSHIFEGLLPRGLARRYAGIRRGGMLLVILLLVVLPWLIPGFDPVRRLVGPVFDWLSRYYLALADLVAGGH